MANVHSRSTMLAMLLLVPTAAAVAQGSTGQPEGTLPSAPFETRSEQSREDTLDAEVGPASPAPTADMETLGGFPSLPAFGLRRAEPDSAIATTMEQGLASSYAISARVLPGRAWARAVAGYDSAAQAYRARSSAEGAVLRNLAIRVDFEHGLSTSTTDRVSLGLKLQALRQETHGLDLGVALFYQPNDFRSEGNLVGALMLGRRFDRILLLAAGLLGTDPEGDDQEVDGRLATLVVVLPYLQMGVDSRFRTALSTDKKGKGTTIVDWELAVLPNATLTLGRMVITAEAGLSSLQFTEFSQQSNQQKTLRTGVMVMSGIGLAF